MKQFREFALAIRAYYEDTDAAGIVYHASYLRFMERARTEWLRSLGYSHSQLNREHGIAFIVSRMELGFLAPARLDDTLQVTVRLLRAGGASLKLAQEVRTGSVQSATQSLLCNAAVRIACVDCVNLRPCRLPETILTEINSDHGPFAG